MYNSTNPSQAYFTINGDTGRIGIGTFTPKNILNVIGDINVTGFYYGNGSKLTGILGSQVTNDLNWINYTTLSQFTNNLGIGNWTADKPNYYNSTQVDNLVVSGTSNNTQNLGGYPASFYMPLNKSVFGRFDFNGGWTNNGLSIIDGNIYAQQGYFYKINALQVTNLDVNGSMIPELDGQFDIGNSTYRWRNANLSGDLTVGGEIYAQIISIKIGFFKFLGSLTNRVEDLFVQNIHFNGTIDGSGSINVSGNIVAGDLKANNNLNVGGEGNFTGNIHSNGNLSIKNTVISISPDGNVNVW